MTTQEAILVIFGLGKDQKPRAARFKLQDEEVACKAAHAMELGIGRAETPEAISLAKGLPEGKPFATGKSLLPLAKRDGYEKLIKVIAPLDPKVLAKVQEKAGPAPTRAEGPQLVPNPWQAITMGSTVLVLDPELELRSLMKELDALQTARLVAEEYGDLAEDEVNRRAELALVEGDFDAFAVWRAVIVFVSDINTRKSR